MDTMLQFFLSIGLIHLHSRRIQGWGRTENLRMLAYTLEHGTYQHRLCAVRALGTIQSNASAYLLRKAVGDRIKMVSVAAVRALRRMGTTRAQDVELGATLAHWDTHVPTDKPPQSHETIHAPHRRQPIPPSFEQFKQLALRMVLSTASKDGLPIEGGK